MANGDKNGNGYIRVLIDGKWYRTKKENFVFEYEGDANVPYPKDTHRIEVNLSVEGDRFALMSLTGDWIPDE